MSGETTGQLRNALDELHGAITELSEAIEGRQQTMLELIDAYGIGEPTTQRRAHLRVVDGHLADRRKRSMGA